MVYLDDGAGCNDSFEHCLRESQIVRSDLIRAGFVINEGKSHFQPGERGGSVEECRTPEREVRGSRPTSAVLCP